MTPRLPRWLTKDELDSVKWLPADLEVVERIKDEYKRYKDIKKKTSYENETHHVPAHRGLLEGHRCDG